MKVAVLSDIHANIYALEAIYSDLRDGSIEKILVIGDLIGYYYWPSEVLNLLRSDPRVICVRGNHEDILSEVMNSAEAADRYRSLYGTGYDVCLQALRSSELDWLVNLPEVLEFELGGCSFFLRHGSVSAIDEYIYPDATPEVLAQNHSDKMYTLFGHTHYPFIHQRSGQYLINPGSVGQPRDVGGLASYVILNLDNAAVTFKRRSFNSGKLIETAKMKDPEHEYLWKVMNR